MDAGTSGAKRLWNMDLCQVSRHTSSGHRGRLVHRDASSAIISLTKYLIHGTAIKINVPCHRILLNARALSTENNLCHKLGTNTQRGHEKFSGSSSLYISSSSGLAVSTPIFLCVVTRHIDLIAANETLCVLFVLHRGTGSWR